MPGNPMSGGQESQVVVYAAQGDARRSLALLWGAGDADRRRATPGPRPELSVDMIVGAAISIADEDGMAALSMRAVGERLGRTAMALYTYVANKNELVDLMYDRVLGEMPTEYDLRDGWRPALAAWARDLWAFCLRHPWVLQVSQARPVLGPHEFAVAETVARIVRASGAEPGVVRPIVSALFQFVRGMASTMSDARRAAADTGVSDDDWWYARSALLAEAVPDLASRYPATMWLEGAGDVGGHGGHDAGEGGNGADEDEMPYLEREAAHAFAAGLTALLDGFEAAIARAGSGPRGRSAPVDRP